MQQEKFVFAETSSNGAVFQSHGWVVRLFALDAWMWKVLLYREGAVLPPSFSVAPGLADIDERSDNRLNPQGFARPPVTCLRQEGQVLLSTGQSQVVVHLPSFRLEWYIRKEGAWVPVFCDRPTQCYNFDEALGNGSFHYVQRHLEDVHFGLGEKAGPVVKTGGRYRMCNIDCMGYDAETSDPLYKHFPYYMVKAQNGFYSLYYDTPEDCVIDLGRELDNYHGLYQYFHSECDYLDYYVTLGHTMQDIVPRFAYLGGVPCLPPRWSLGYLASSMGYADAPDAQVQLESFLQKCKDEDIPVSGFHLSSGYTRIGEKRYVFNWDTGRFPSPKNLFTHYAEAGVRLIANIKPCLLLGHPLYAECQELGLFIKSPGDEPLVCQFWDGEGSYLDFSNPRAQSWWEQKVQSQLLDYGIHATWNDNNEFEIWDRRALCAGVGGQVQASRLKPIFTLQMLRASKRAQVSFAPGKRPYLISRSGCHGMQRYVQTWSGDNNTHWKTLRYNHKMGMGMSLSAIYNYGHDVGGFAGPKPPPELFVRWVQHGIFMPRFSIHSWNEDGSVNEPWMYPEQAALVRRLILLRYRLLPYLYSLLHRSCTKYTPIVCPVFYHFPQVQFYESDLYMLGEDMLVANVFDAGVESLPVALPNGAGWYGLWDGEFYAGGGTVVCNTALDAPPAAFVRAGSVLPLATGVQGFEAEEGTGLACRVFAPDTGSFTASFFTDDGESDSWQDGAFLQPFIVAEATESEIVLQVDNLGSQAPNSPLRLEVVDRLHRPVRLLPGGLPCTLHTGQPLPLW